MSRPCSSPGIRNADALQLEIECCLSRVNCGGSVWLCSEIFNSSAVIISGRYLAPGICPPPETRWKRARLRAYFLALALQDFHFRLRAHSQVRNPRRGCLLYYRYRQARLDTTPHDPRELVVVGEGVRDDKLAQSHVRSRGDTKRRAIGDDQATAKSIKYGSNDTWTVTSPNGAVVTSLTSSVEHTSGLTTLPVLHMARNIHEEPERQFLLLVLLYSEAKRLDRKD
ncbi:hypothetical protein DFH06DRAFT_1137963 [Mycena polygramma]|nr:hypothetical protein DFH06DRAFT_1137963 [Mycena polygramma]